DRIADQQAARERDRDVRERPHRDGPERMAGLELRAYPPHRVELPVERVPGGNRVLEDRVDCPERDRDHRVRRNEEEEDEPDSAGEGERRPEPAPRHPRLLAPALLTRP